MMAESRLIAEWVALVYPGRNWHRHFRVGGYPDAVGLKDMDEGDLKVLRNRNRWVDMVLEPPPDLVVIEAKMWDASNAIGKLKEYLKEVVFTPEYIQWGRPPITPIVLTGQHDPLAQLVIEEAGLRYVFWEPPWIADFYAFYPERRRHVAPSSVMEAIRRSEEPAT